MNYEEFCAALQEELLTCLTPAIPFTGEHVLKTTGSSSTPGSLKKQGKHCSPVISLEMLYEQFEKDILCRGSAITWYRSLIRNFRSPWRV